MVGDQTWEEFVSTGQDLSTLHRALSEPPAHTSDLYTRYRIADRTQPFFAQILRLPSNGCGMSVHVSKEALDVDFRSECTRRDVPGIYRERPGIHLSERLAAARQTPTPTIFFNGNNIGYWGNQFAIEGGRLIHKERGPVFDDGKPLEHAGPEHFFFSCSSNRFAVERYDLRSAMLDKDTIEVRARPHDLLPAAGLSGIPLVHGGQQVWQEHLTMAWDPRLLYEVGRLTDVHRGDVLSDIRSRAAAGEALARHPMTLIGVTADGHPVLVVVEQSTRSRGISLAEAAALLIELEVRDGVALGAAGDAQLATTDEGFLTVPLVDAHVRTASRKVPVAQRSADLAAMEVFARPVPCMVSVDGVAGDRTAPMSLNEIEAALGLPRRPPAAVTRS